MLFVWRGKGAPASAHLWLVFQLLEEPHNTKGFARAVGQAHSIFKKETYMTEMLEEAH